MRARHISFLVSTAALATVFSSPLRELISLSLHRDEYSHTVLIPFISLFLIYWQRKDIFARTESPYFAGLVPLLFGVALYGVGRYAGTILPQDVLPSLSIGCFVVAWAGAFLFLYGPSGFRAALFPIGFVLFMVPVPDPALAKIIYFLQQGSSDAAALLLRIFGVPFYRDGFVFQLPGVSIMVAAECSGIRSSIALLIIALLAAHFLLRSNWSKAVVCILVFPIAVAKNGLRIATLSFLAVYVNRNFLFGRLHHYGGMVFFFVDLIAIWGVLLLLRRCEGLSVRDRVMPVRVGTCREGSEREV